MKVEDGIYIIDNTDIENKKKKPITWINLYGISQSEYSSLSHESEW